MKLVSYLKDEHDQLALAVDDKVYDLDEMHPELPSSMNMFLTYWEENYPIALAVNNAIINGKLGNERSVPIDSVQLLSPVPFPTSCRDAYAFRQHVAAARRNRKWTYDTRV